MPTLNYPKKRILYTVFIPILDAGTVPVTVPNVPKISSTKNPSFSYVLVPTVPRNKMDCQSFCLLHPVRLQHRLKEQTYEMFDL